LDGVFIIFILSELGGRAGPQISTCYLIILMAL